LNLPKSRNVEKILKMNLTEGENSDSQPKQLSSTETETTPNQTSDEDSQSNGEFGDEGKKPGKQIQIFASGLVFWEVELVLSPVE
jgi:hypothetical protein